MTELSYFCTRIYSRSS